MVVKEAGGWDKCVCAVTLRDGKVRQRLKEGIKTETSKARSYCSSFAVGKMKVSSSE